MRRHRRSVAAFCIAVIAIAALAPGLGAFDHALLDPLWVLLPDEAPVEVCPVLPAGTEQPLRLLSLLPSRAPPSTPLA
ncbi:MAG TPA: hypothetical protein VD833_21990 [Vicinamibacterales bacterium]|nr:hypothetical protein [Vicinamibacterales bacterium]